MQRALQAAAGAAAAGALAPAEAGALGAVGRVNLQVAAAVAAGRQARWEAAAAVVAVHQAAAPLAAACWAGWRAAAAGEVLQRAPAAAGHVPVQEQIPALAWVQGRRAAGERAPVVKATVITVPVCWLHLQVTSVPLCYKITLCRQLLQALWQTQCGLQVNTGRICVWTAEV